MDDSIDKITIHQLLLDKMDDIQRANLASARERDKRISELATAILEVKSDVAKSKLEVKADVIKSREEIKKEIAPVLQILTNAHGFTDVVVFVAKAFGVISLIIGGLYALIEFFKKIGR